MLFEKQHRGDCESPFLIFYLRKDIYNEKFKLSLREKHPAVENMIREAFWNVCRPGCPEHYVIHKLRDDDAFVPELTFVMELDGKLIGQNMFMKGTAMGKKKALKKQMYLNSIQQGEFL